MNTFRDKALQRISKVWSVWGVGACLFLFLWGFFVDDKPPGILTFCIFGLLFCGGIHLQSSVASTLDKQYDFNRRFVSQYIIDTKLVELAQDFYNAEVEYVEACSVMSKKTDITQEEEDKLASLQRGCQVEKKRFWKAHGLAEWFDYGTLPKYKDYLSPSFVHGSSKSVK